MLNEDELKKHLPTEYGDLITRMKSNYGDYSREEILEKVGGEGWMLFAGRDGSTGVRTDRGHIVMGSPPPESKSLTYKAALMDFRSNIVDLAMRDNALHRFYNGLMLGVDTADPRALQIFRDIFLGRAPDLPAETATYLEQRALEDELKKLTGIRHADGSYTPPDENAWKRISEL